MPAIKAVAAIPTGNSSIAAVALVGRTAGGIDQLILRTVHEKDGSFAGPDQVISLVDGTVLVDVMFSRIDSPGAVFAICDNELVLEYRVAFDSAGLPKLMGDLPTIHGPFGDPAIDGSATVISEAPNWEDPKAGGIIAIGTASGRLHIVRPGDSAVTTVDLGPGPITGLAAVAQVGFFAFAAAHNGHVIGVNAKTGAIVFDLAEPRPDPLIDLSNGAVFEPNSEPLTNPIPVPLVTANGTRQVAILQIPANPTNGGVLAAGLVVIASAPIGEADAIEIRHFARSLFMLTVNGAVLYSDKSGATLTIAGAVAELSPDTLNLASKGRFVTAMAECQNNLAAAIDTKTLALRYGGFAVAAAMAAVGDRDGDGQIDVTAKFDLMEVEGILHGAPAGPVILTLTWTYNDGTAGSAAADLRIVR